MPLLVDIYTVSGPRTGDAIIKDLELSGWDANYNNLEQGRLYWRVNTSDELELFKDEGYASADLVCSGPITAGDTVTLAENNSSGISGSARVGHTDGIESTGEVIVSYASELDMLQYQKCIVDYLDDNGQFNGEDRFENPLKRAKLHLDKQIRNKLDPWFRRKGSFEVDMSAIAKPRQLSEIHALYALYLIFFMVNAGDEELSKFAEKYKTMSGSLLDLTILDLDQENDDIINSCVSSRNRSSFTRTF